MNQVTCEPSLTQVILTGIVCSLVWIGVSLFVEYVGRLLGKEK